MNLGEWLKRERKTQDAFGMKVGLTQSRVSQIVADGTNDLTTAAAIQAATDNAVTIAELMPKKARKLAEAGSAGAPA